jgi:hypothetical protein
LPITAVDSVNLALEHTKNQLFRPFRIGQWTKLAFVGLLAGELGANGCNRSNFHVPAHPAHVPHVGFPGSLGIDPPLLAALIGAFVIAAFAIGIILMYVSSVMRFVLFDSILLRECHIRWGWNRRLGHGWRYFIWKLGYLLISVAGIALLVGVPVIYALAAGWYKAPKEHLLPLAMGGTVIVCVFLFFLVATAIVLVLTKDFVIPQMALEGIGAMEGWRRLWPMMKAEKEAYATYIAMKIVLALVAAALIAIATVILGLMIAVPSAMLGLLAVLTGKSAGLTWNAHTIALAVFVGCILLAGFLYLVSLVSVPVIVFFPAYSIYFFAARYPRLSAALNPSAPEPQVSPGGAPAIAPI